MDPDANLARQRELARRLLDPQLTNPSDADELAELVIALDAWLQRGGFLPAAWDRATREDDPGVPRSLEAGR